MVSTACFALMAIVSRADAGIPERRDAEVEYELEVQRGALTVTERSPVPGPPVHPDELLRKAADGADALRLVEFPWNELDGDTYLTVADPAAVQELLKSVETPPIEPGALSVHGCVGSPPIRLYRQNKLVAEFSFDHGFMLRAISGNLWSGDVHVTPASAVAIARWFDQRGYGAFQREVRGAPSEEARRAAVIRDLPEALWIYVAEHRSSARPTDSGPEADAREERLAKAFPHSAERVRQVCRALGMFDGDWGSPAAEEVALGAALISIPEEVLASSIDGFQDDSPELRGAAWFVFGPQALQRPWTERLHGAALDRLLARCSSQVLRDGRPERVRHMVVVLAQSEPVEGVERILAAEQAKLAGPGDAFCSTKNPDAASAPVLALLALAGRGRADLRMLQKAAARPWLCRANAAVVSLTRSLACGERPRPADLVLAGDSAATIAWRLLEADQTREGIDVVLAGMLGHASVRGPVREWLAEMHGDSSKEEKQRWTDDRTLLQWWRTSRSTWSRGEQCLAVWSAPSVPPPLCASLGDNRDTEAEFAEAFDRLTTAGGTRPAKAKAGPFHSTGLPEETETAAAAERAAYAAASALAAKMDAIRLSGRNDFEERLAAKYEAAKKAQAAFDRVCAVGQQGTWCQLAEFEKARIVESVGDSWVGVECRESGTRAADCGLELYMNEQRSRSHWAVAMRVYSRLSRACEEEPQSLLCARIREGLCRLEALDLKE